MTARERIDAAIAARDKATPEPLEVVFKGTIGKYTVEKQEGGVHRQLAYCGYFDALLFAAAPDLVDEVIRLRKWQQEASKNLLLEQVILWSGPVRKELYQQYFTQLNRLIAEAEGEQNA